MKNLLILITLLFPLCSYAQTYKCVENAEKIVVSEKTCEPGTEWPVLNEKKKAQFDRDIAGVKLWMTESQALKALAKTLDMPESDIKPDEELTGLYGDFDRVYAFDSIDGFHYLISVITDFDNEVNDEKIVNLVSKSYGFLKQPLDYKKIKDDLIKKYGEPSETYLTSSGKMNLNWCSGFEISDQDEGNDQYKWEECSYEGALLSFGTQYKLLQMKDLRYDKMFLNPKYFPEMRN